MKKVSFACSLCAALLCVSLLWCMPVSAASTQLKPGSYPVDASLSCYIPAMGGVEFGAGLFTGAHVTVDADGSARVTLGLTASTVTIYSVTCDTFVDAEASEPGYYDASGKRKTAQYTKSKKTALNAKNEAVHYVDAVTFPVSEGQERYYLWLYVNSNVMGAQFCDGTGSGSSGSAGEATPYQAIFTMDWSGVATVGAEQASDTAASNSAEKTPTAGTSDTATASQKTADKNFEKKNFDKQDSETSAAQVSDTASAAVNTASSAEQQSETSTSADAFAARAEDAQARETMDGLHIYPADDAALSAASSTSSALNGQEASVTDASVQASDTTNERMLLYVCIGLGMVFILLGGVFLLSGSRTKEHVIVIRFEHGDRGSVYENKNT